MRLDEPSTSTRPADDATRVAVLEAVRPRSRERWFTIASYFSPLVILLLWELARAGS